MLLRRIRSLVSKMLYGLKQSPKVWFEMFSITISSIDFHRCHLDHSVFVRRTKSDIVVLVVYVDDILLTGSVLQGYWRQRSILSVIL